MDHPTLSNPALSHLALVWCLFFLICFSLGYPTLNRYDPNTAAATAEDPRASLTDTQYYASLIKNGFMEEPDTHWRYRVLVPYVAKPFYTLLKGKIGSWNPVFFSLLLANSIFVASAALLLFLTGAAVTGSRTVGFISSLLCLCHFNISNLYLAGLVDSSELFVMVLTIWLALQKKWRALPLVALLAFLSRETTVVFSSGLAFFWFAVDAVRGDYRRPEILSNLFYIFSGLAIGLCGLVLLRYVGKTELVMPWHFAGSGGMSRASVGVAMKALMSINWVIYSFVWLLPLGLLGLRSIPKNWLWSTVLLTGVTLVLIVVGNAGENAGRPLFNVAGPMLLVAAAAYIAELLKLERSS